MQRQYGAGADGVPMGKWVAEGTSGGTTMGYFDRYASPAQWKLADEFVLLDHWFQGIHGGSFANHFYLISGGVARFYEGTGEGSAGVGSADRPGAEGTRGTQRPRRSAPATAGSRRWCVRSWPAATGGGSRS